MKFLTLLFSVMLLALTGTASAEDTPPANSTPAVAPTTPAAPTNPAPAGNATTPTPANKPDDDTQPGAFKRRLEAAKAVITGNHAALDSAAEKDAKITALTEQVNALTKENNALKGELTEAVAYCQSLKTGTAAAAPASPVGQAAADAVSAGIAAAAKSVGIPTTNLTQPAAPAAAPALPDDPRALIALHFERAKAAAPTASN